MKTSMELLKKANITPKLKLAIQTKKGVQGTGPHRVKLLQDKEAMGTEPRTGKEREEIAYLVEENGQKKSYRVPKLGSDGQIHYLVQRLAEFNEGDEVILEYTRKGIKGYISVLPVDDKEIDEQSVDYEDIPIVENENEQTISSESEEEDTDTE